VQGDFGSVEMAVPRDRMSSFQPKILPKHERRVAGLDDEILSLYTPGMTTRDIQSHLEEMYSVEVSPSLINAVSDAVMDEVQAWQSRPLKPALPAIPEETKDSARVSSSGNHSCPRQLLS
jgi:putative transposase